MNNRLKQYFLFSILTLISLPALAQQKPVSIYPTPQHIKVESNDVVSVSGLDIKGTLAADLKVTLTKAFPGSAAQTKLPLIVKKLAKGASVRGAYHLSIRPQSVTIEANDDAGVFYAIQTLTQLRQSITASASKLPVLSISDFPDVAIRGTVEGFYGEPWSHADRLSQFLFYGQMKLNTYIYGPKDDPYHSSPNWRMPYPEKEAELIKDLVANAAQNRVDFVWAIHPGKDIKWNKADSIAILKKFDAMYQLGVRSFAVFFDDISGDGTDAKKQAGLLNYIQREFVSKRKDVKALIMCPTEYNKGWSNPKPGTYLDILGDELDPAVFVMWTGNTVIADNTKEGLAWVNKRIKRPAFVWWNFPVSDYVRDHLLMGPSYGLASDVKQDMSGFVSNPMDKAEASKVALFGVADYAWNLKQYDHQASWEAANRWVMPEAAAAFRLFNSHNSDLGPNGHGYRRGESEEIKPLLATFMSDSKVGVYALEAANQIAEEFRNISAASVELQKQRQNKRLIEQINPWLQQFNYLGKAGTAVMNASSNWNSQAYASAWGNYIDAEVLLDSMAFIDKKYNQNPYQPGVKTGSLRLTPFVKEVFEEMGKRFIGGDKGQLEENLSASSTQTALITNSEKLKSQPLQLTNNSITISPVLEVLKLAGGDYFGIRVNKNLAISDFNFNLESNNLLNWGRFEVSADGQLWMPIAVEQKKGKGQFQQFDPATKYLRFINTAQDVQSVYLKSFKMLVKPIGSAAEVDYAVDGSISTYQVFSAGSELKLNIPAHLQKKSLVILVKSNNAVFDVYTKDRKGKKASVYQGNDNYIQINAMKIKKNTELYFNTTSSETIRIYEVKKEK